jgi:hypothetical protein
MPQFFDLIANILTLYWGAILLYDLFSPATTESFDEGLSEEDMVSGIRIYICVILIIIVNIMNLFL